MVEYRSILDATKDVQFSGKQFILSSLIASETDHIHILDLFGIQGEDWLTEVIIKKNGGLQRQKTLQKKFLTARNN